MHLHTYNGTFHKIFIKSPLKLIPSKTEKNGINHKMKQQNNDQYTKNMYTYQLMPTKQEVPTNHHHIPSYCKNADKSSCEHDIKLQIFFFIGKQLFILSIFENNGNDLYAVIFFSF